MWIWSSSKLRAMFAHLGLLMSLLLSGCGGAGGDQQEPPRNVHIGGAFSVSDFSQVMLEVYSQGGAPTAWQWRLDGADLSGATGPKLQMRAAFAMNGAQITVQASNQGGSATSPAITLLVRPLGISIGMQPPDVTVSSGQSVSFAVVASGSAPIAYQWRRNGVAIPNATASVLTLPAALAGDDGAAFDVVLTNPAGSATSRRANLRVTSAAAVAPSITSQPDSVSALVGSTATFRVAAMGDSPLTYQWLRGGVAVTGATAPQHTTPMLALTDSNSLWSVRVSNAAGNVTSRAVTLIVTAASTAPTITAQPSNVSVDDGQGAEFVVAADGTAPLAFQWRRNGADIAGATSARLVLSALALSDSGARFSVRVSNAQGTVTSADAVLTVRAIVPAISVQPADATAVEGNRASFSVTATGSAPLAYQWRRRGVDISGATSSRYETGTLAVSDDGVVFDVRVSNAAGSVISRAARLAVSPALQAPAFSRQPLSVSVNAGQAATFTATATGNPSPAFQWRRNGTNIAGATQTSYTITVTSAADSGASFTLAASNSQGSVVSNAAVLTVQSGPTTISITTQPVDRASTAGQRVTFQVSATGPAPLAYQWFRDDLAINNANAASYTTPELTLADDGTRYAVRVSSGSSVTPVASRAAVLSVTPGSAPWNRFLWGYAGRAESNSVTTYANGNSANVSHSLYLVNPDSPTAPVVLEAAGQAGPVIRDLSFQTEYAHLGQVLFRDRKFLSMREGSNGWLVYTKGNRFMKVNLARASAFPQPQQLGNISTQQVCAGGGDYLADEVSPDQSMLLFFMPPAAGGACGTAGTRLMMLPLSSVATSAPIEVPNLPLLHLYSPDGSRRGFLTLDGQQVRQTDMRFNTVANLFTIQSGLQVLFSRVNSSGLLVFRDGDDIKIYDYQSRTSPRLVQRGGSFVPLGTLGGVRSRLLFFDNAQQLVKSYGISDGQITALFAAQNAVVIETTPTATVINTSDRLIRVDSAQNISTLTDPTFAAALDKRCLPGATHFVCNGVSFFMLVPKAGGTTVIPRVGSNNVTPGFLWKLVGDTVWFSGVETSLQAMRDDGSNRQVISGLGMLSVKRVALGESDIDVVGPDEWTAPFLQSVDASGVLQIIDARTRAPAVRYGAFPTVPSGGSFGPLNFYRSFDSGLPQLVTGFRTGPADELLLELFMVRGNQSGLTRVTNTVQ